MSTYAGRDAATDQLVDFIAGGVPTNRGGESGGNYNAVIGDAGATEDLSQKTLAEIYALQDQLRAAGRPSSAIGRYQIIKSTLSGLQDKLKLPDDTKFTPELQDRLAVELMVGRGYSSWWKGTMTDEDFAHGLSLEWASLPDPANGGKSHYDGVGPNHASTTLEAVYAALTAARAVIPGAAQPAPERPPSAPAGADDSDVTRELNRRELDRVKATYGTPGNDDVSAGASASQATAAPAKMAPGVAVGYAGFGISALAGTIQFLWPLLHGQMPMAPSDLQAANLAGLLFGLGGGVQHVYQSWQQRRGNR